MNKKVNLLCEKKQDRIAQTSFAFKKSSTIQALINMHHKLEYNISSNTTHLFLVSLLFSRYAKKISHFWEQCIAGLEN
jgi:hypothetical protein